MALERRIVDHAEMTLGRKLLHIRWLLVLLVAVCGAVGGAMLYSAAHGNMEPWAQRHVIRICVGIAIMLAIAIVDVRFWMRHAYLIYLAVLSVLAAVDVVGMIGMGAQRWLDLGFINLQPSELMKIALVLALARYFHGLTWIEVGRPWYLMLPLLMVAVPVLLVLKQPDLGTAIMLLAAGGVVCFAAGVRTWKFATLLIAVAAAMPLLWEMLREYQRQRVLTFLDPERDPLGAGYHIIQSKIALGSGGLVGKGFLQGTQSHLNFLPERQTDFIFTMLAEEFGMAGGVGVLFLFALILAYGFAIALSARSQFGRLLSVGITSTLFLYVFINVAMVMGLIPVVGVPLPLVSFGGTAMLACMVGLGLMMSVHVHRDAPIGVRTIDDEDL